MSAVVRQQKTETENKVASVGGIRIVVTSSSAPKEAQRIVVLKQGFLTWGVGVSDANPGVSDSFPGSNTKVRNVVPRNVYRRF